MKTYPLLYLMIFVFFAISCEKNNIGEANIFTKIYSDQNSDISYYPLDIKQTADEGYLVLGSISIDTTRTWLNTYVAQIDKEGEMQWSSKIALPYVNPVGNIIEIGGENYIFCMDNLSLQTHVLKINNAEATATQVATIQDVEYPLAVSNIAEGGALLLGYDRIKRSSVLAKIDASFKVVWKTEFLIKEDAEPLLVEHLLKTGKTLPFFTGSIGEGGATHYFANGLYNYTLSLLFVKAAGGDRTGIGQGYRFDGGASSLLPLQGNTFAMSRFSFNRNFLLPTVNIDINSISSINDYGGAHLAEIADYANTITKKMKIKNKDAIVFACNTNNNQVVIYAYDLSEGKLILRKNLGFEHPVMVGGMIQTKDEGIAILVQTMVAGRFKRLGLYKIPKEHL